ncbi:hypothetical protein [Neptunomonas sp.]|uniref:phage tail tube protein n=1 Tax=Neptunomonas sp. TaxID=1971898 RepID=UPI0035635C7D
MADVLAASRVGAGTLYVAALGSTLPTDLATAWDAAWVEVGYTEAGHEFEITPTFEDIEVAEELSPIATYETARNYNVRFNMAEYTAANLKTAFNGGTITAGTGIVTFEPPDAGVFTEVMLGWEATDAFQRRVWKRCIQTGTITVTQNKAPNRASIPVDFRVLIPTDNSAPWFEIIDDDYQ